MTDLKSYDLPELEALAEQIKAEIEKREREEEERLRHAAEVERLAAEAVAREAAAAVERAAHETARAARAAEAERLAREAATLAATKVRYMHPSNRALTWSGVGPTPDWVNAWLVTGGTLYALEVAAEKLAPRPIPDSFKPR